MPMDTEGEIAVVRIAYATEEAYSMGHGEFSDVEAEEAEEIDFSLFTDSARWINVIAPKLRAMAGYGHSGRGSSHTEERQVAAILPGCEEDTPAEADLLEARYIYDELFDAYRMGALDAVEDTYDPDAAFYGLSL